MRKRFRVSNKVKKVAPKDRFRLSISRSAKNISAQIIDDTKNVTLLSASSIEKDLKSSDKISSSKACKKSSRKKYYKNLF
jgi:large subunit ribosomal protein L18